MLLKLFFFIVLINICVLSEHYGIKTISLLGAIMCMLAICRGYLNNIDR